MKLEKTTAIKQIVETNYANTAGIVVLKDGELAYEQYFNGCTKESTIHVYSVSKSILSILIGIAIEQGYIKSINQNVLDFFPNYKIKKNETLIQTITLSDLLTMSAPYKYKEGPIAYIKYFKSNDWITHTLDLLGGKGQVGEFRYTPLIGPDILTGILANATGQSVLAFARENLFKSLGISVKGNITFTSAKEQTQFNKATNISGWVTDQKGLHAGGWGLTLTAMDMAKIGQLCLQHGRWDETQLVSADWIKECTQEHNHWKELDLPFGYLWWLVDEQDQCYAAMGDGGNVIYVNPKKNIVISIASLFIPKANDRLTFIKEHILPLIDDEQ